MGNTLSTLAVGGGISLFICSCSCILLCLYLLKKQKNKTRIVNTVDVENNVVKDVEGQAVDEKTDATQEDIIGEDNKKAEAGTSAEAAAPLAGCSTANTAFFPGYQLSDAHDIVQNSKIGQFPITLFNHGTRSFFKLYFNNI
ncbi:hypothetical protein Mgra_00006243 [Meloidogyne graminicola]|uniref:Uncharacterized protein n=1 Tax=Meloidogyne graminicola TaxID=189291 RepID=A0A8S9ZLT2_9BILA|nr:hypothetical protein Mgra_00006243 [Meloidogyne graminicola]